MICHHLVIKFECTALSLKRIRMESKRRQRISECVLFVAPSLAANVFMRLEPKYLRQHIKSQQHMRLYNTRIHCFVQLLHALFSTLLFQLAALHFRCVLRTLSMMPQCTCRACNRLLVDRFWSEIQPHKSCTEPKVNQHVSIGTYSFFSTSVFTSVFIASQALTITNSARIRAKCNREEQMRNSRTKKI